MLQYLFIIGHVEFLATVQMNTPFGISRDVVMHAFGANCLEESDSIVIVTKSVDDYPGAEIPRVSGGFFNGRCDIKYMYAVTKLLSPSSAEVPCSQSIHYSQLQSYEWPDLLTPFIINNILIYIYLIVYLCDENGPQISSSTIYSELVYSTTGRGCIATTA
jgi:hypothetical protein